MPSPNVLRQFSDDSFYHVYNRGVEKRIIFLDEQDYRMFRYYLFVYLADPRIVSFHYPTISPKLKSMNLYGQAELATFCCMPNHFHLLLYQTNKDDITKLLRRLTNAYTKYFNEKYHRVGGLVQGRYQAVCVNSEAQLLQLARYIHLNPVKAGMVADATAYPWSGLYDFVNKNPFTFCRHDLLLPHFKNAEQYLGFMQDDNASEQQLLQMNDLLLEEA